MMKGRGCDHFCLAIATIAGLGGIVTLILAWIAAVRGDAFGYGSGLWYSDAQTLFLLGIFCLLFVKVTAMHGMTCAACGCGGCGKEGCGMCGGKKKM